MKLYDGDEDEGNPTLRPSSSSSCMSVFSALSGHTTNSTQVAVAHTSHYGVHDLYFLALPRAKYLPFMSRAVFKIQEEVQFLTWLWALHRHQEGIPFERRARARKKKSRMTCARSCGHGQARRFLCIIRPRRRRKKEMWSFSEFATHYEKVSARVCRRGFSTGLHFQ